MLLGSPSASAEPERGSELAERGASVPEARGTALPSEPAEAAVVDSVGPPEPVEPIEPTPSTFGCYVWGGVGGGKSLLMDLLVECCGPGSRLDLPTRRVHFHEFMHEVHRELHARRKAGTDKTTQAVARGIASKVQLLAFDEFQITNISDALIVETLFDALFTAGVAVVMTSNRPTRDLYKDGLNRHLAIPQFLALLARRGVAVVELDAARDFRALPADTVTGDGDVGQWRDFFCKAHEGGERAAEARLLSAFSEAAGSARAAPLRVPWRSRRRHLASAASPSSSSAATHSMQTTTSTSPSASTRS